MNIIGVLSYCMVASLCAGSGLEACTPQHSTRSDAAQAKPVARTKVSVSELPVFESTVAEIDASQKAVLASAEAALRKLAAQNLASLTFSSTFADYDRIVDDVASAMGRFSIIENTALEEAMRIKAQEANQELTKWDIGLSFREDVYRILRTFADLPAAKLLQGEERRLMELTLLDFERSGLKLSPEKRAHLKNLNEQIAVDTSQINSNIIKDRGTIKLSQAEMEGVPEDVRARLRQPDGSYLLKTSIGTDYVGVMENAAQENVRKKVMTALYNRAKETNRPLIVRTLRARAEIAQLLGYASWADYQIAPKMATTAKNVNEFLLSLSAKIEPKFKAEQAELAALKGGTLNIWDVNYYIKKLTNKKYNVDTDVLRNYFAMEKVLGGMFRIYEKIMGIEINEVEAPYKWVADLKLFAISNKGSREPLGYVYMDMYPREGKYGHFAEFGILQGIQLKNGRYRKPVAALVCNFPSPEAGKPALLGHNEVTTLFHEFGHSLHHVLTHAKYGRLAGTNVPADFVEAPSQLLERWAWDPAVLDTFAVHYQRPNEKIPREILAKMNDARLGTVAHVYKRQLNFDFIDMKIHSYANPAKVPADPYSLSNGIFAEAFYPAPEGTAFLASFGHLFDGYDAGYYGYAWSDAITADLATAFQEAKEGFLDASVGHRLRKEIYEMGNSRDPNESIKQFLGRPWNDTAFAKYLGVTAH